VFKSIGIPELLIILVIVFIFFGAGKLPQVGAQLGKAIRGFKKAQSGEDEDEKPEQKTDKLTATQVPESTNKTK
jgi:sec-independent protein translocase protein TatA